MSFLGATRQGATTPDLNSSAAGNTRESATGNGRDGHAPGVHDAPQHEGASCEQAYELARGLAANLRSVLLGAPGAISAAVVCALAGGHLLIEDVPGVGKTMLARGLASSLGCGLSRVQGHPDLLPSDVVGVSVYSQESGTWDLRPGPLLANVVLFDELNRTPPRTQSALLEAMEEGQTTIDGETYRLPVPHMVIVTQNPVEELGTFPLVESQRDRFAIATSIGYPDAATEAKVALEQGGPGALADLEPVCGPDGWLDAQRATRSVFVDGRIAAFAVAICDATRRAPAVRLGASPRAAMWLLRSARAHALVSGRDFTTPGDVKAVAVASLAHRLVTDEGIEQAVDTVRITLDSVSAPRP